MFNYALDFLFDIWYQKDYLIKLNVNVIWIFYLTLNNCSILREVFVSIISYKIIFYLIIVIIVIIYLCQSQFDNNRFFINFKKL